MPSTNYFPPPSDLQGIVNLPNGMMAGFRANEIWFCEPYLPHAWPPGYVLTTDFPIVGLGVTSGAVVACTGAMPYVASGVSPSNMSLIKCNIANPCASRGSILSTDGGVYYACPNGLIMVNNLGQATNTTELWFTREKWAQLTPQKNTRAISLVSSYFCMGTTNGSDASVAQQGFTIEMAQDNASFTIWPQPGGHRVGFTQLTAPQNVNVDNVLLDPWTGIGLLVQNGAVYYYDFTDAAPTLLPYTYRSKTFQSNNKKNYKAMKAFFSIPPNTPAQNAMPNTKPAADPSWNTLQAGQYAIVRTFADFDGTGNLALIDCREVRASGSLLPIVSGFKAEQWAWEITGRVLISNLQVATSVKELANV